MISEIILLSSHVNTFRVGREWSWNILMYQNLKSITSPYDVIVKVVFINKAFSLQTCFRFSKRVSVLNVRKATVDYDIRMVYKTRRWNMTIRSCFMATCPSRRHDLLYQILSRQTWVVCQRTGYLQTYLEFSKFSIFSEIKAVGRMFIYLLPLTLSII